MFNSFIMIELWLLISLVQMKHAYPCLTAFIMTEHWLLKKPKMLPSHIFVECQKWRCSNHHKMFANMSYLTGVGMSLVQIKHTYPCSIAFTMTQLWLKQPKILPSHIVIGCQKWRCSNHLKTPAYEPSLTGVGMSLVEMKHTYPCLTAFIMTFGWSSQKYCPATLLVECQKMKVLQPWQNACK